MIQACKELVWAAVAAAAVAILCYLIRVERRTVRALKREKKRLKRSETLPPAQRE